MDLSNERSLTSNQVAGDIAVSPTATFDFDTANPELNLKSKQIGVEGAEALAKILRTNSTWTSINLSDNEIGDEGTVTLATALAENSHVTNIHLGANGIGDEGAEALAAALSVNRTLREIRLGKNKIGDKGAGAFAHAIRNNATLKFISLSANVIGDYGAARLARAIRYNSTLETITLEYNGFRRDGFLALVESIIRKVGLCEIGVERTFLPDAVLLVKYGVINAYDYGSDGVSLRPTGKYPTGLNVQAVLRKYGAREDNREYFDALTPSEVNLVDLADISRSNHDGSYCAVAAAMQNDVDKTLQCLRLWPERAGEVLRERYGSRFAVTKSGLLLNKIPAYRKQLQKLGLRSSFDFGIEAIEVAVAVAEAIQSTATLSLVNIHLCGEGYAGKTMTKHALLRTLNCGGIGSYLLPAQLPDIALEEGRTLGMVSEATECMDKKSAAVRVLLHDYGGQEEFRANHAPHLSAPNSVYVIVVPLWDMRPGFDKPYKLEDIVVMYTQWLKLLYTVIPSTKSSPRTKKNAGDPGVATALPQCITVINFVSRCSSAAVEKVRERLVQVIDTFNAAPDSQRLNFNDNPIVLDVNLPVLVYNQLAPVLKRAIVELSTAPIPLAPCLQTVLADKEFNNGWPLFTTESQLKGLIMSAIKSKHALELMMSRANGMTEKFLCEITQGMLESRRDIIVFPMQSKERVSINRPNWLTNEILGSLFDPQLRPQIARAAAVRAAEKGAEETHLLSLQDINAAVTSKLDSMTRATIDDDDSFIPKLLQHVGVCIPVIVDTDGLVRAVAEGADASNAQHWFPAFSTILMKETDGSVLSGADHVIARQFKLKDAQFCIFPPGYFSSLFVSIVSLYNTANLIEIYANGMVLRSATDRFQIVVRQASDTNSFVVTVATVGSASGSDLAFQTIQDIKNFIYSESDWRGNVRVQEWCLHPVKLLRGPSMHIKKVAERLRDPKQREDHLAFYFGLERGHPLILQKILDELLSVSKVVKQIAHALETFHKEFDAVRVTLIAQLRDQQDVSLEAVHDLAEALELSLCRADSASVANSQELTKILDLLTSVQEDAVISSQNAVSAEKLQALVSAALQQPLQQVRTALDSAGEPTVEQLQTMKDAIVSEVSQMCAEMHGVVQDKLQAADEARTAAAQEALRHLMRSELQNVLDSRDEQSRAITASQVAVLLQRLDDAADVQEEMWEEIVKLRGSVQVVRSVQMDAAYGVYDTPLLLSITQPPATGNNGLLQRALHEVYRVHFICPCCGKKAASGPKGRGYKLNVTKAWVARMSKVLRCTLLALQVLSLMTPVPLPHLADLAQYLPGDRNSAEWKTFFKKTQQSLTEMKELMTTLAGELGVKPFVAADARSLPIPPPLSATSTAAGDASASLTTAVQRPVITLEHVTSVLEVLQMAGEAPSPSHPKQTGLTRAICSSKGQCAWVCNGADGKDSACKTRYIDEGNDCLAIQMVLA